MAEGTELYAMDYRSQQFYPQYAGFYSYLPPSQQYDPYSPSVYSQPQFLGYYYPESIYPRTSLYQQVHEQYFLHVDSQSQFQAQNYPKTMLSVVRMADRQAWDVPAYSWYGGQYTTYSYHQGPIYSSECGNCVTIGELNGACERTVDVTSANISTAENWEGISDMAMCGVKGDDVMISNDEIVHVNGSEHNLIITKTGEVASKSEMVDVKVEQQAIAIAKVNNVSRRVTQSAVKLQVETIANWDAKGYMDESVTKVKVMEEDVETELCFINTTSTETCLQHLDAIVAEIQKGEMEFARKVFDKMTKRSSVYLKCDMVEAKGLINSPWWIPWSMYLKGRIISMTRILLVEFRITLAEARERAPGMIRKLPQFISRLVGILMMMLLDIEDDPAWHSAEVEDEDAGATNNFSVSQECLDKLSIALGEYTIVPAASEQLLAHLAALEWQKHHAAIIALTQIAEGCSKVMIKNLEQVVNMVLNSFHDLHPRVRWAAISAIGQLSTDLQVQYYQRFLPVLAAVMYDCQTHHDAVMTYSKIILVNANDKSDCMLRAKAMEFDSMIERSASSRNTVITCYCKEEDVDAARLVFNQNPIEDMVLACVRGGTLELGAWVRSWIKDHGLCSNLICCNTREIVSIFALDTLDLAEAKKALGARNKQLHQLWYRSITLQHIIAVFDQIAGIAKLPARIEKLIAEKQFYVVDQLHVQSTLMIEREALQPVGSLQDVRSELTKLRGVLFYKILEDLHAHLYNKGEYSSAISPIDERDDLLPPTMAITLSMSNSQSLSRRTRSVKVDNHVGSYGLGDGGSSFDGHDKDGGVDVHGDATSDGHTIARLNGGNGVVKDVKIVSLQIPTGILESTPDEFVEAMRKLDAPLHMKYQQTMVECLCMLRKVVAAGAIICQRLRPTIHEKNTTKLKTHAERVNISDDVLWSWHYSKVLSEQGTAAATSGTAAAAMITRDQNKAIANLTSDKRVNDFLGQVADTLKVNATNLNDFKTAYPTWNLEDKVLFAAGGNVTSSKPTAQ